MSSPQNWGQGGAIERRVVKQEICVHGSQNWGVRGASSSILSISRRSVYAVELNQSVGYTKKALESPTS
jgi:hypothetical protein